MADRCFVFFFFKQKTAYDMRISDWSSDVCSSDLACSGASQTSAQGSSPSGGETSEPLRRAEPDDARVEREDVGAEQGVVAVGEGVGGGCLVEDIVDIELQREIIRRQRERNREVEIEIGRAHVCTPVPTAALVCRLLLHKHTIYSENY